MAGTGVNDEIYDRLVDNAAMSRLYENEINVETNRIVNRHKDRLYKVAKKSNSVNCFIFSTKIGKRVSKQ